MKTETNLTANSENISANNSGQCGDNLKYILDGNILVICGSGDMFNYAYGKVPWYNKHNDIQNIIIQDGVTSIGEFAFLDCSSLTSITIPSSVTSIGQRAFSDCSSLTSVTIPNSVTSIGAGAFYKCSSLTSINIPNSVTSIGTGAFDKCSSLTSITIPNSVAITSIESVFDGCSGLTSITIPKSVTNIRKWAFSHCRSLSSIFCYALVPPKVETYFDYDRDRDSEPDLGVSSSCVLCVPQESVELYRIAPGWRRIERIIGI